MTTDIETPPSPPSGVTHAIAVAARIWRAKPWSLLLTLGILTLASSIIGIVLEKILGERNVGAAGFLLTIVQVALSAPLLAVQLRVALAACRGLPISGRDLLDGLRMSGHMLVVTVLLWLPAALFDLLPSSSGDEFGWREGSVSAAGLLVMYLFVRLAMSPILTADTLCGPFEAFRRSWRLTQRRFWPLFGFGLLHALILLLLNLLTGGRRLAVSVIFDLAVYPLSCLAYVHLYQEYAGQPRLAADGLTPAAEA